MRVSWRGTNAHAVKSVHISKTALRLMIVLLIKLVSSVGHLCCLRRLHHNYTPAAAVNGLECISSAERGVCVCLCVSVGGLGIISMTICEADRPPAEVRHGPIRSPMNYFVLFPREHRFALRKDHLFGLKVALYGY